MKKSNFTRLGIQMGFGIYSACIRNANIVKKHFIQIPNFFKNSDFVVLL